LELNSSLTFIRLLLIRIQRAAERAKAREAAKEADRLKRQQELEEQMRLEREAEEARLAAIFEAREAERRARESESLRKKTHKSQMMAQFAAEAEALRAAEERAKVEAEAARVARMAAAVEKHERRLVEAKDAEAAELTRLACVNTFSSSFSFWDGVFLLRTFLWTNIEFQYSTFSSDMSRHSRRKSRWKPKRRLCGS
jgi:hypothetical protein